MRVGLVIALLLNGCSSSDFDVADQTSDAAVDQGTITADSTVEDTAVGGDVLPPSDAPCTPPGANPSTIYVDGRTTRASIGTADCPFKTIAEALAVPLAAPSKRTIKIAGGSDAPVVYNETTALVVNKDVAIVGDGESRVTLSGSGPCGGTSPSSCTVVLHGGASIEGVTISAGPAIGIAMIPGEGTNALAKMTVVTGGTGGSAPAVYVAGRGAVTLGPGLRVHNNVGPGLVIDSVQLAMVNASSFDGNAAGVVVKGGTVAIDGGQALANKTNGVALLSAGKHSISNFAARENLAAGVYVEANASLKMRTTTLVKNRYGMVLRFGTNDIDLGTLADYGKNVFGGASASNTKAGISAPLVRSTKAPAAGNKWLVCEPTRLIVPMGGCEAISTYQDVYYAVANVSDPPPLDWSACDPGP